MFGEHMTSPLPLNRLILQSFLVSATEWLTQLATPRGYRQVRATSIPVAPQ